MKAYIVTIGDEILIGSTLDSNSHAIAQRLTKIGFTITGMLTVNDTKEGILEGLHTGLKHADLVLMTGGLGPTRDDITKKTLADFFEQELVRDEAQWERLKAHFAHRDKGVLELNEKLAYMPSGCTPIPNTRGTALGMWFEKDSKVVVSMPGVPHEMKSMLQDQIEPKLAKHFKVERHHHRYVMLAGMGESTISNAIEDIVDGMPKGVSIAFLPSLGQVKLRFTAKPEVNDAEVVLEQLAKAVTERLPKQVYSHQEENIEVVIGRLLKERGKTIGLAESCTGGYVAHRITSVPGSSAYYEGSVVTYSYRLKEEVLGVKKETLTEHGAVSEEVVEQMALGTIDALGVDYAISISGIAGPGGGLPDKPVGTVWIAVTDGKETRAKRYQLTPHRMENIKITSVIALNQLRCLMLGL